MIRKVAILLSSLKFGGAERAALNLAGALKAEGIELDVLVMSREGEFLEEAGRDFSLVDLRCDRTYKLPGRLHAYIRREKPDALVSSFWKLNLCACLARVFHPRMRLILWEHSQPSMSANSPTWLYGISASFIYPLCSSIVAVSTGVATDIDRITLGLGQKLTVIFNPIKPPAPAQLPSELPSYARKRLVWVGRLDRPKNPGLALEAFALLEIVDEASLAIVGDGGLARELAIKAESLGILDRVTFVGYLPDPYEVIANADLLVLSSDREGLGNVIIEAMYCGLRVVSTDCGEGVHEILLDGEYGTIVPRNDAAALARGIETELSCRRDPRRQIEGAQRFLPRLIAHQFLATIRGESDSGVPL